jgi:hypothetical protein
MDTAAGALPRAREVLHDATEQSQRLGDLAGSGAAL